MDLITFELIFRSKKYLYNPKVNKKINFPKILENKL